MQQKTYTFDEIYKPLVEKIHNGNTRINSLESQLIRMYFPEVPASSSNNWTAVCMEGSDWKYGHFYIDVDKKIQRGVSFEEFYRGGIVD